MSRLTSIPEITIETRAFDDEDITGRVILHPIIRGEADGYSLGTLALNEMADLHILRARIDEFIFNNNIPMEPSEDLKLKPPYTDIIEGYLSGYQPMDRHNFNPKTMTVRSSQEIVLDLADMVDIELNDVAASMSYLGYKTCVIDHKVGWLLGRRNQETTASGDGIVS